MPWGSTKLVLGFVFSHQEVDMAGAHYELIRRYVNSSSLPHIEVLRTTLASIWGENACVGGENIIKMFPVRVINAGAPATLRFLQQHCLAVAGLLARLPLILMLRRSCVQILCFATALNCKPPTPTDIITPANTLRC